MPKSDSTVKRILKERGYILPRPIRWREPLVLPEPMTEWEIDFGEIRLDLEHIFEFFMVADRGTSRLVYLEGSYGYRAESALEALYKLFLLNGLPQRLRFDRDPRLWGAWSRDSYCAGRQHELRMRVIDIVPRKNALSVVTEIRDENIQKSLVVAKRIKLTAFCLALCKPKIGKSSFQMK